MTAFTVTGARASGKPQWVPSDRMERNVLCIHPQGSAYGESRLPGKNKPISGFQSLGQRSKPHRRKTTQ